jgi:DsbC/DsbD-like thiol-disulfide interchange protein
VFHNRAVLLVPLQIAADASLGTNQLSAKVSWVECEKTCVLGNATVTAKLTIGSTSKPSPDTNIIAAAQEKDSL